MNSGIVPVVRPGFVVPPGAAEQYQASKLASAPNEMVDTSATWDKDGVDFADIPKPVGWRILVEPIAIKDRTSGGIILPDQSVSDAEYLRYVGLVVALGPAAYQHAKFAVPDPARPGLECPQPWCKPGDWVVFGRYAGQEIKVRGLKHVHRFRLVNDDEVQAVAERPEKLVIYVG